MKDHREEEVKLRKYLLGELTLEQQVLVEQRLFLDDDYSHLAEAIEDELIDQYTSHDLTAGERTQFETHFLRRPEHSQDLRIAQALKRFVVSQPIVGGQKSFFFSTFWRRPIIGISFATLLIVLSVIGWITFRSLLRQDKAPQLQGQDLKPVATPANGQRKVDDVRPEEIANRSGSNKGPVEANERKVNERKRPRSGVRPNSSSESLALASVVEFTIPPGGLSRSEAPSKSRMVTISSEVETVILILPLTTTQDYDSYRATLKSRGRTVHNFPDLKSEVDEEQGKVVPLKIPAKMLRPQNYEIELSGVAQDQRLMEPTTYFFQAERK